MAVEDKMVKLSLMYAVCDVCYSSLLRIQTTQHTSVCWVVWIRSCELHRPMIHHLQCRIADGGRCVAQVAWPHVLYAPLSQKRIFRSKLCILYAKFTVLQCCASILFTCVFLLLAGLIAACWLLVFCIKFLAIKTIIP